MFDRNSFKDQIALVTGGSKGIGYIIAKQMLLLGAKVIIISRDEAALKKSADELSEFGTVDHKTCNIKHSEQIQQVASMIKEKHGRLDILINNAGGQFPALAEMINDKGWNAVINNSLNGTFFMTRETFW